MRIPPHYPALLVLLLALSSCGTLPSVPTSETSPQAVPTSSLQQMGDGPARTTAPAAPSATPEAPLDAIVVQFDGPTRPFDRRLLGTNLPAWLGADTLRDPAFQALTVASGTTLLRLPGGSWSNHYDWRACETGDAERCAWPWAARPSDFAAFLRATNLPGMWTVSFNGTAQEAAALVAFFNGSVDDARPLGLDQRGRDWMTVGHWARLRVAGGNAEPLGIQLWEVGNEIYGARPSSAGAGCAEWGWEDVWTCDGAEYVSGKGAGTQRRDGFLSFREAMLAVDPTIQVGAVGVEQPGEWSGWGDKVIAGAGDALDFYVVHQYPYSEAPSSAAQALAQPERTWPRVMDDLRAAFELHGVAPGLPVAVTEYNLVAFQDFDSGQFMRRAVNALFLADSIGQMAGAGVRIANQWNLANGRAENGTDYGMIEPQSGARNPAYYALLLWSRMGEELLTVRLPEPMADSVSVYATRDADGVVNLLVINKSEQAVATSIQLDGAGSFEALTDTVQADALLDETVTFNGVASPALDLADAPARALGTVQAIFDYSFPSASITRIQLTP